MTHLHLRRVPSGVAPGFLMACKVLGLPGAAAQSWFVFNVSRPDEIEGESQVVTVKSILDPAKVRQGIRWCEHISLVASNCPRS